MDQFEGYKFLPTIGRDPIELVNPGENSRGVQSTGRGRGRATGRPRAFFPIPEMIATDDVSEEPPVSLSSSSDSSTDATWGSMDDVPEEERLKIAFGDVEANSDEFEKEKTEDIDKQSEPEAEGQEKKADLPPGFLDPLNFTLSHFSDTIEPGDKRYCAVYTMTNTNTISLITCDHFSRAVDNYIAETGAWYRDKMQEGKLLELNVREDQLVAGAIVVVHHTTQKEWKRARIVESFEDGRGRMYKVLFLDLGDMADVNPLDIYYMHESWREMPVFAIKARLQLNDFYNSPFFRHNFYWNKVASEGILDAVMNKMVLVKFIEQVEIENDKIWNISLLSMKHRGLEERPVVGSGDEPIEEQVIDRSFRGGEN